MKTLILYSYSIFAHMCWKTLLISLFSWKSGVLFGLFLILLLSFLPAEALAQTDSQEVDKTIKTGPVIQKFKSLNLRYETGRIVSKIKVLSKRQDSMKYTPTGSYMKSTGACMTFILKRSIG